MDLYYTFFQKSIVKSLTNIIGKSIMQLNIVMRDIMTIIYFLNINLSFRE